MMRDEGFFLPFLLLFFPLLFFCVYHGHARTSLGSIQAHTHKRPVREPHWAARPVRVRPPARLRDLCSWRFVIHIYIVRPFPPPPSLLPSFQNRSESDFCCCCTLYASWTSYMKMTAMLGKQSTTERESLFTERSSSSGRARLTTIVGGGGGAQERKTGRAGLPPPFPQRRERERENCY